MEYFLIGYYICLVIFCFKKLVSYEGKNDSFGFFNREKVLKKIAGIYLYCYVIGHSFIYIFFWFYYILYKAWLITSFFSISFIFYFGLISIFVNFLYFNLYRLYCESKSDINYISGFVYLLIFMIFIFIKYNFCIICLLIYCIVCEFVVLSSIKYFSVVNKKNKAFFIKK